MVRGIGVDLIEIERVARLIERDPRVRERLFTAGEIAYCESKYYKAQHYAARFTAKEAFFKAVGTGLRGAMSWLDVAVENDILGKPHLYIGGHSAEVFRENGMSAVHLSLSHTHTTAVAMVVVE